MRTAIISDLHLGTTHGEDVVRDPAIRQVLLEGIAGADRLILLGDVLELRELPMATVLEVSRPFFEELGEAMAGRQVVLVPGNHDHRLAEPLLEQVELSGQPALGLEQHGPPPHGSRPPTPRRRSRTGSARPTSTSPIRGSGCARTSTPPTAITWTAT